MKRQVTIYSNVIEGYNENAINEQLKKLLVDYPMPENYDLKFTGKQQEQEQTQDFLIQCLDDSCCFDYTHFGITV